MRQFLFTSTGALLLFMAGCDKNPVETAEENITTVVVHLTGPNLDQEFTWDDTDGDGIANSVDTIVVPALTGNIAAHIHVYDRSVSPELDLGSEIEGENTEHLFVYTLTGVPGLTISGLSTDANGAPFGMESLWESGQPTTGTLNIELFHEPSNKNDATNPGGEVDFSVNFPVVVR